MTDEERRAETEKQHRGGGEFILPLKEKAEPVKPLPVPEPKKEEAK